MEIFGYCHSLISIDEKKNILKLKLEKLFARTHQSYCHFNSVSKINFFLRKDKKFTE